MNREYMKELVLSPSVSGFEEDVQKKNLAFGKSFAHKLSVLPSGAVIASVNEEAPCKVLLMGHADEIGFIVTHITSDGMIKVSKAGGVRPILYIGTHMQILHKGSKVPAVVAVVRETLGKGNDVACDDLVLDIGAASAEEARKVVSVGDPVCQDVSEVYELMNDNFSCKALDDRTGVFVIMEAAKKAAEMKATCGIYAACTVGEETTGIGAHTAAGAVHPACAIAVDVTWASDCPGTDPADTGLVKLGAGPVIAHGSMVNKKMNELLETIAEEKQIPIQHEIAGGRTFTDGDTVSLSQDGIPIALVSIPLRYMHSSVEVGNWRDLENAIDLLAEFLCRMDENFVFEPFAAE